jgi:hypothetical protein
MPDDRVRGTNTRRQPRRRRQRTDRRWWCVDRRCERAHRRRWRARPRRCARAPSRRRWDHRGRCRLARRSDHVRAGDLQLEHRGVLRDVQRADGEPGVRRHRPVPERRLVRMHERAVVSEQRGVLRELQPDVGGRAVRAAVSGRSGQLPALRLHGGVPAEPHVQARLRRPEELPAVGRRSPHLSCRGRRMRATRGWCRDRRWLAGRLRSRAASRTSR